MKIESIYGSMNNQLGTSNYVTRLIEQVDLSRYGIFATMGLHFDIYNSKVVKSYKLEAYELNDDGEAICIHFQSFKTKAELKKAFKNFQLDKVV